MAGCRMAKFDPRHHGPCPRRQSSSFFPFAVVTRQRFAEVWQRGCPLTACKAKLLLTNQTMRHWLLARKTHGIAFERTKATLLLRHFHEFLDNIGHVESGTPLDRRIVSERFQMLLHEGSVALTVLETR